MDKLKNIAVLIDAENAQPSTIKEFLKKISSYGYIGVKQAFADWSKPTAKNWDAQCKALSINRVMQGSEVKGKNAVDIALVVEAMDLLNKNHFDGFAIVSSDSDYKPLIDRIKKDGIRVIGVGKNTTPKSLKGACDVFIVTDEKAKAKPKKAVPSEPYKNNIKRAHKLVSSTFKEELANKKDEGGWVRVSQIGEHIKKNAPDFKIKSTGSGKYITFFKKYPNFYEVNYQNGNRTIPIFRCIKS